MDKTKKTDMSVIILFLGLALLGVGLWAFLSEINNHKWREVHSPIMHDTQIISGILLIIVGCVIIGYVVINKWHKHKKLNNIRS